MAIFVGKSRALYTDHDRDPSTPAVLAIAANLDPEDYADFFASDYEYVVRDREITVNDLTQEFVDSFATDRALNRHIKMLNENFGSTDANGEPIFEPVDVTQEEPVGTLRDNFSTGSYYGTFVHDGAFFLVVNGTSGSFQLFGNTTGNGFRFPETIDGTFQIFDPVDGFTRNPGLEINVGQFDPSEFTNGNDLWSGGREADNANLLGGNDVGKGGGGADAILGGRGNDSIQGQAGADRLFGGSGRDNIKGGGGKDVIDVGAGGDRASGGNGSDLFIFKDNYGGNNKIRDFDANDRKEKIDLTGVTEIKGFRDLKNNHLTRDGSDVVIDDGAGTVITLMDVAFADIGKSDFVL